MEPEQDSTLQEKLSQKDNGATSVAPLSNTESIITIPITRLNKYVIIYEVKRTMSARDLGKLQRLVTTWSDRLDRWWQSDSKFFAIVEADGTGKVRFERIEQDEDAL